jgi:hypothetical protein
MTSKTDNPYRNADPETYKKIAKLALENVEAFCWKKAKVEERDIEGALAFAGMGGKVAKEEGAPVEFLTISIETESEEGFKEDIESYKELEMIERLAIIIASSGDSFVRSAETDTMFDYLGKTGAQLETVYAHYQELRKRCMKEMPESETVERDSPMYHFAWYTRTEPGQLHPPAFSLAFRDAANNCGFESRAFPKIVDEALDKIRQETKRDQTAGRRAGYYLGLLYGGGGVTRSHVDSVSCGFNAASGFSSQVRSEHANLRLAIALSSPNNGVQGKFDLLNQLDRMSGRACRGQVWLTPAPRCRACGDVTAYPFSRIVDVEGCDTGRGFSSSMGICSRCTSDIDACVAKVAGLAISERAALLVGTPLECIASLGGKKMELYNIEINASEENSHIDPKGIFWNVALGLVAILTTIAAEGTPVNDTCVASNDFFAPSHQVVGTCPAVDNDTLTPETGQKVKSAQLSASNSKIFVREFVKLVPKGETVCGVLVSEPPVNDSGNSFYKVITVLRRVGESEFYRRGEAYSILDDQSSTPTPVPLLGSDDLVANLKKRGKYFNLSPADLTGSLIFIEGMPENMEEDSLPEGADLATRARYALGHLVGSKEGLGDIARVIGVEPNVLESALDADDPDGFTKTLREYWTLPSVKAFGIRVPSVSFQAKYAVRAEDRLEDLLVKLATAPSTNDAGRELKEYWTWRALHLQIKKTTKPPSRKIVEAVLDLLSEIRGPYISTAEKNDFFLFIDGLVENKDFIPDDLGPDYVAHLNFLRERQESRNEFIQRISKSAGDATGILGWPSGTRRGIAFIVGTLLLAGVVAGVKGRATSTAKVRETPAGKKVKDMVKELNSNGKYGSYGGLGPKPGREEDRKRRKTRTKDKSPEDQARQALVKLLDLILEKK